MSLIDFMRGYAASGVLRLHTPGHKGTLSMLDITELADGSFPEEQLCEAEKFIAGVYGASHARLLACGSSQGVKAAIYYAAADGIVDVNSHRSVFDGFRLAGKKCVAAGKKGVRPIELSDIKRALTPDMRAVVVTSPTYYGFCADIKAIADFCRREGLIFIIDGAHGAHFGFGKGLPAAFANIPDICNLSAHKTLSALTQSAIICDNLDDKDSAELCECVNIMGTTSPSYLLYASTEHAVRLAASAATADAYAALLDALDGIRGAHPFLKNDDGTRLVLDCERLGIGAAELNAELARRGVMSEMTDGHNIVFIFTAADAPETVVAFDKALTAAERALNRAR